LIRWVSRRETVTGRDRGRLVRKGVPRRGQVEFVSEQFSVFRRAKGLVGRNNVYPRFGWLARRAGCADRGLTNGQTGAARGAEG